MQVIEELPICVAGVHVSQRFFITAAVTTPILGMNALTCLGIQINFGTGEIYMEGTRQTEKASAGLGVAPLCGGVKLGEEEDIGDLKGEGCADDELAAAMTIFGRWEDV